MAEVAGTCVVYSSGDERSAGLIAEKMGFTLLQTPATADPSVYSPQYDDNNIVCVGLWVANAYTKYYFPNLHIGSDGKLYGEHGISADGRRIISIIRRANGTTVTVIGGIDEVDTWEATNDYCAPKVSLLIPIGVSTIIFGGVAIAAKGGK